MTLIPTHELDTFASLPARWRDEVRAWMTAIKHYNDGHLTKAQLMQSMHASRQTVDRKLKAFADHGWRGLAPNYRGRQGLPAEFVQYWKSLCESYQRKTKPAVRELYRRWQRREIIPGYEGHPGWPNLPDGWNERTLYRYAPTPLELTALRHGLGRAVAKHAPKVLSTRVGTWHLSHIVWDDVWLDAMAHMLGNPALIRVLQIGALDLHSGCRFHYGTKPQLRREDNSRISLNEADMRLALAAQLHQFGLSPRGTTYVIEHGTATIRDRVRDILTHAFPGIVSFSESGITGKFQALAGLGQGQGGGNFRHKAALESLHNLIHNELAALPAQTGHDRDEPEFLAGIKREHEFLYKLAKGLGPEMLNQLKFPALEYHTQFLPILHRTLELINQRTDHQLEGWEKLGYLAREYRLSPATDTWTPEHDLTPALIPAMRQLIQHDPDCVRVRKLSPREVFDRNHHHGTLTVPTGVIADILYQDLAKPVPVRQGYLRIQDRELSPEPMHFEARVTSPDGRESELREGETYEVVVNPFDPRQAWVYSGRARQGSFMGLANLVQRASRADHEATQDAHKRASQRLADLLTETRARNAHKTREATARHTHNERVAKGIRQARNDFQQAAIDALDASLADDDSPAPTPTQIDW